MNVLKKEQKLKSLNNAKNSMFSFVKVDNCGFIQLKSKVSLSTQLLFKL